MQRNMDGELCCTGSGSPSGHGSLALLPPILLSLWRHYKVSPRFPLQRECWVVQPRSETYDEASCR